MTDKEVKVRNFKPTTDKLSNYEVRNFEKDKISVSRVDQVLSLIDVKSLNEDEELSIHKICAKYADIFHLENDQLSVINVAKQKLTTTK